MFDLSLRLSIKDGVVRLTFPLAPRLVSLALALVLGLATFATGSDIPILGVILTLALALTGLYREFWIFDVQARTIAFSLCLGPILRKREWTLDQVEALELETFIRGQSTKTDSGESEPAKGFQRYRKPVSVLRLVLATGDKRTIETLSGRKHTELLTKADQLSQAIQKPLTK